MEKFRNVSHNPNQRDGWINMTRQIKIKVFKFQKYKLKQLENNKNNKTFRNSD